MNRCFGAFCGLLLVWAAACGDDREQSMFADAAPRIDADTTDAAPPADASPADAGTEPDAEPGVDAMVLPDAPMSELGPEVTVMRILQAGKTVDPAENTTDFTSGRMVTAPRFSVVCEVVENETTGTPVDSTSVSITAIVGADNQSVVAQPTPRPNEFIADFDLTGFANGTLEIRCTASDIGAEPETNTGTASNFLDLGPRILVVNPVGGAHYANQIDVLIQVQANPVAGTDTGAAIPALAAGCGAESGETACSVRVCVGGKSVPLTVEDAGAGLYTTTIYFDANDYEDDAAYSSKLPFDTCAGLASPAGVLPWSPPIDGATTVDVYATNGRSTVGTTRLRRINYVADSKGPAITITKPVPGELVGGFMTVEATVEDPAGVADVRATIAHTEEFVMVNVGGGNYVGTFDTRKLDQNFIFPLVEVRAKDGVGNGSGVGRIVVLDNQPPYLDFDPPAVREGEPVETPRCLSTPAADDNVACQDALDDADCLATWSSTTCTDTPDDPGCTDLLETPDGVACRDKLVAAGCNQCFECSRRFDPVGPEAVNFGATVRQLGAFRLRAEDTGNRPASVPRSVKLPLATMDTTSVQMYVFDNAVLAAGGTSDETPMLMDTDLDDESLCDAINPDLIPTTIPLTANEMAVIDLEPITELGSPWKCTNCELEYGISEEIDDASCTDYTSGGADPGPACGVSDLRRIIRAEDGSGPAIYSIPPLGCMGNPFDAFATNISQGWACVLAVGQDKLGNVGMSRPMPVCFYYGAGAPPAGVCDMADRPTCTDGCTYPKSFIDDPAYQLIENPPQCSDGIDNDEDGFVDYPADAFCTSPDDASEG